MSSTTALRPKKRLSPSQLRKVPQEERDALLAEAAAQAEPEYRTNLRLADFEAFREEDKDELASPVALCVGA